ncbi:DNA mismatch repair protein msh6 [Tieghemiomyces parasiticus]|uniref:DNA mismatch repair protein msh6 n=1 Tax=Tieghemiomyces parasiticus TaxID=78921 RepID=A0A9W8DL84_9FUNG|nr:DNA mismatch repair protein msh6 [Tieghemiomyces parasiticus]
MQPTPNPPSSPLTPSQKARMEQNRLRALKKLQEKQGNSPSSQRTLVSFFGQKPTPPPVTANPAGMAKSTLPASTAATATPPSQIPTAKRRAAGSPPAECTSAATDDDDHAASLLRTPSKRLRPTPAASNGRPSARRTARPMVFDSDSDTNDEPERASDRDEFIPERNPPSSPSGSDAPFLGDEDSPIRRNRRTPRATLAIGDDLSDTAPSGPATPTAGSRYSSFTAPQSVTATPRRNLTSFMSPAAKNSGPRSSTAVLPNFASPKPGEKNPERFAWLVDVRDADRRPPTDPDYDPRTLYIPPAAWSKFTPFERQFWEIKAKYFDTVVFFKKGKFYELYENDADVGHQQFDLKLTDRVNMRMVGVPESSFEFWAAQFVAKGYKIAKVDQVETALGKSMREKTAKTPKEDKIIRRELTSILTAGTLVDGAMLHDTMATYCFSVKEVLRADHQPPYFGLCFVDTATGQFQLCGFQDDTNRTMLETLLIQMQPKEVVFERGHLSRATQRLLKNLLHAPIWNGLAPDREFWDRASTERELLRGGYFSSPAAATGDDDDAATAGWPAVLREAREDPAVLSAVGGLISYLRSLKLDKELVSLGNFTRYQPMCQATSLIMDGPTMANLELFQTSEENALAFLGQTDAAQAKGSVDGTLFQLLNRCVSPFGKRLFRQWLCHPLRDPVRINERLDTVEDLTEYPLIRDRLRGRLAGLPDLERLISRVHSGTCRVRDLLVVLKGFNDIQDMIIDLRSQILQIRPGRLATLCAQCPDLTVPLDFFATAFDHTIAEKDGNIVPASGVEPACDQVNAQMTDLEARFAAYLKEQRTALRCPKLEYKDIGKEVYQLDVPKAVKVPATYMKLSATKASNRYWTPTLQQLVKELNELLETRSAVFRDIERRMYQRFDEHYDLWLAAVRTAAELDCLVGLTEASGSFADPVCRPELVPAGPDGRGILDLAELRHPCIRETAGSDFIPNDTVLGRAEPEGAASDVAPRMILLTGPNAGGKSTLLRQTCLAVIMAQLGCFVPARHCRFTPVDRIFTRIGAHDDILRGQSTFMVELSETSTILREATPRSLVILDELGRGTSTFDGYAVAYSVLHHLATRLGCLGLFSTHYHALTREFAEHPQVRLMHMDCHVDPDQRQVTFLYKLVPGVCPKSYGMNVANMAGIPNNVVDRAERVAEEFESTQKLRALPTAKSNSVALKMDEAGVPHHHHAAEVPMHAQADFKFLWQWATQDNHGEATGTDSLAAARIVARQWTDLAGQT